MRFPSRGRVLVTSGGVITGRRENVAVFTLQLTCMQPHGVLVLARQRGADSGVYLRHLRKFQLCCLFDGVVMSTALTT